MSTSARIGAWAVAHGLDPAQCTATCDGETILSINGSADSAREAMALPKADVDAYAATAATAQAASTLNAKAKAAPTETRRALRALESAWIEMGYEWPPKEGQLLEVVADRLALVETAANAGQVKQAVIPLAKCVGALVFWIIVGRELALTPDVPAD
jgi:hypothetical protein